MFKGAVAKVLDAAGVKEAEGLLEVPPNPELGDFAFPCFSLSKMFRKSPAVIAGELAGVISAELPSGIVERVSANGPYLNFYLNKQKVGERIVSAILEKGSLYGTGAPKSEKVMVEYPAPNTNKPLHLGHVRNMLLGNSICSIMGFAGFTVVPVDLVNDRGIHICKSMLAYKKWGNGKEPDKKSDHFVGDYYVLFSKEAAKDEALEGEALKMLVKWERNDLEVSKLWAKMRKWALDGFKETYAKFGVSHKKSYYESEIYQEGKLLVMDGLKKGVFEKDEKGAVIVDLEKEGLGKKVLLRDDGTSIYITQDLYLAKAKFDEFRMDRSVYVVGNEQAYHFKVLFSVLKKLGLPFADKCYHLSYGMISLPEGRMKSREGTVVDADDLVDEMEEVARLEIEKRHKLSAAALKTRSKAIGMGAIKFFILKYDPMKDFVYTPEESISFDGETGPYVQYAHARICSIFKQVEKWKAPKKLVYSHSKEHALVTLLARYPDVVAEAAEKYNPALVARYSLELAQTFSSFYVDCPVLKAEKDVKDSRLALCHATRVVLQSSLALLGIDAPEAM